MTIISVYVASLHHYNCGELRGAWIDLPCADLKERIERIVDGHEEYAIHDTNITGLDHLRIGEYTSLDFLNDHAERLEKMDEDDLLRVDYLLYDGEDLDYALDHYEDVQMYKAMDLTDVAEELVGEGLFGEIPEAIKPYIDYAYLGRDLRHDGYTELGGHTYWRPH